MFPSWRRGLALLLPERKWMPCFHHDLTPLSPYTESKLRYGRLPEPER